MDNQTKEDIEFLLSFAPVDNPDNVPEGLSPMFYFTTCYEGDKKLAERVKDIKERYQVPLDNETDSDK